MKNTRKTMTALVLTMIMILCSLSTVLAGDVTIDTPTVTTVSLTPFYTMYFTDESSSVIQSEGISYGYENALGKVYLPKASNADANTVNTTEKYLVWDPTVCRLSFDFNYKMATNRRYEFHAILSADSETETFASSSFAIIAQSTATTCYEFSQLGTEGYEGVSKKPMNVGEGSLYRYNSPSVTGLTAKTGCVCSESKNNSSYDDENGPFYFDAPVISLVPKKDVTEKGRIYGFQIRETQVDMYDLVPRFEGGTLTAVNKSLNRGTTDVTLEHGKAMDIETNMGADITVTAPDKKVIDTVKYVTVDGSVITDFTEDVNEKASATVTLWNVTQPGYFDVTYKNSSEVDTTVVSFDLSKTENTVLCLTDEDTTNDTTQIEAIAYRADGKELNKELIEDLTYTSNNTNVATVSEDGLVTAVNEGAAVITVSSGEVTDGIVIMVGMTNIFYDIDTEPTSITTTLYGWDDGNSNATGYPSEWSEAQEIVSDKGRSGSKSVRLRDLSRAKSNKTKDDNGNYIYDLTQSQMPIYSIYSMKANQSNAMTVDSVEQLWFYDDGTEAKEVSITFNADKSATEARYSFGIYLGKETYTKSGDTNADATINGAIPRSKGWHQVVSVGSPTGFTVYVDGQQFGFVPRTNFKQYRVTVSRSIPVNMSTANHEVWIDDFAHVDITDIKANVTVTYDNTNGAVKVGEEGVVSGEAIAVDYGKDLTLTFEPKEGYEAKVEGYTLNNNQLTLENIKADATLTVTFEKLITTPSITGNGESGYLFKEANYNNTEKPAYVSFYKIVVPAGFEVKAKGYGMYLNGMQLIAEGKNEDNMFGIRVFGPAINDTDSYEFKGFATLVKDGEETIVETEIAGSNDAVNQQ